MDADDLPLLGEPLPVELANTRYGDSDGFFDFLGSDELAQLWLTASGACDASAAVSFDALRSLRDCLHRLLCASVAGQAPDPADVEALNEAAAQGRARPTLVWAPEPQQVWVRTGSPTEVLLARLSAEAIAFLAGPERARLRVCAALDCTLFYVQDHHRRRFCHPSCSHRMRQAAYYRRKQGQP